MADPNTQVVQANDGKTYNFPQGISQGRIDKYFAKIGTTRKVDIPQPIVSPATDQRKITGSDIAPGASIHGISQDALKKNVTMAQPPPTTGASPGNVGMMQSFAGGTGLGSTMEEGAIQGLPFAGSVAGSMLGGPVGSGLGAFVGEDFRQMLMRPILQARGQGDMTAGQSFKESLKQGIEYYALDKVMQKPGEMFFKYLNEKVPKAMEKYGIPLLKSDTHPNSRILQYVTDLLSNLGPSAKTMAEFRNRQLTGIETRAGQIADGFSKFKGSSEDFGNLIQSTLEKNKASVEADMEAIRKQFPPGKRTIAQAMKDPVYFKLNKELNENFRNKLAKDIMNTRKPQLIAGMIRAYDKSSAGDAKIVMDHLKTESPAVAKAVKTVVLRDIFEDGFKQSATGKIFSGSTLQSKLDAVGEEKLKVLYTPKENQAIQDFMSTVRHVDKTQGNGTGRFLNLIFIVPFRGGFSPLAVGKIATTALVANRAAKIITSPEGVKIYEGLIRSAAVQSPKLAKLYYDEMKTFNEKSDREYEMEQKEADREFKEMHPELQGQETQ